MSRMPSLVDQFCPNVHDAPITACAFDPGSGVLATGDSAGRVAVTRRGETAPGMILQMEGAVENALGLIRGGHYVAVGDNCGSVRVFRCDNGQVIFEEIRKGDRGRVRAMRGMSISPEGSRLASIAVDGLVRLWDLTRGEREIAWQGFGGITVEFDARGDRLLCVDEAGQPRLIDLRNREAMPMDRIKMPADEAFFSTDNTFIVCSGPSGISLLRVADGALLHSFATRGGSGIGNVVLSPDGRQAAALTRRSVHVFSLPDLQPVESLKHGAPDSSGVGTWTHKGILVAGADGLMHGPGEEGIAPIISASGFGEHRIGVHADAITVWRGDDRLGVIRAPGEQALARIDRDGQLVIARPMRGPVSIYATRDGRKLFEAGPDTDGAPDFAVGGPVVAVKLPQGGVRWWHLGANQAFELAWPRAMALSGSGTWLGVVTPKGAVRVLDPATGRESVPSPVPLAEVPVKLLSFVNRSAELLILDEDGVLGHYDLRDSKMQNRPAEGRDVLDFNVEIDRIWGITGGRHCALRLPEGATSTVLFVDLEASDVVSEVTGLHPFCWVDPETGCILERARSGAILERDLHGKERRVLRSLPGGEWISYTERGILGASDGAGGAMG
ncbi:MAG: hypothetical protein H6741_03395 [Alphaproteobacteria bacterium]|nr:hypothetical protein [Alphaproteobacteria bacterium]